MGFNSGFKGLRQSRPVEQPDRVLSWYSSVLPADTVLILEKDHNCIRHNSDFLFGYH